jgi:hypothetical protein
MRSSPGCSKNGTQMTQMTQINADNSFSSALVLFCATVGAEVRLRRRRFVFVLGT